MKAPNPSPETEEALDLLYGVEEICFEDPVEALGFAQIEHVITFDASISAEAYRLYAAYKFYAHQGKNCWPSGKRLMDLLHFTSYMFTKCNQELTEAGLIIRQRRVNKSSLTTLRSRSKNQRLQVLAAAFLSSRSSPSTDTSVDRQLIAISWPSTDSYQVTEEESLEEEPLEEEPTTYFLAAEPPKNGGHDAADHAGTTDQPVQEHELSGGSDCSSGSDDRGASAARGVSDGPDRGSEAAPGGSPRTLTLNERFALEAEADRKREAALRRIEEARNAGKQHDEDGDPVVQHEFALLIARACNAGSLTKDQLRKLNAPMLISENGRLVEGPSLIQMWNDPHWHSGLKTHFEETVKTMRKQLGKTPDRTRLVSAMRNYEPHGKVGSHAANQVGGRSAPAKPKLTGKYDWFDGDTIQD